MRRHPAPRRLPVGRGSAVRPAALLTAAIVTAVGLTGCAPDAEVVAADLDTLRAELAAREAAERDLLDRVDAVEGELARTRDQLDVEAAQDRDRLDAALARLELTDEELARLVDAVTVLDEELAIVTGAADGRATEVDGAIAELRGAIAGVRDELDGTRGLLDETRGSVQVLGDRVDALLDRLDRLETSRPLPAPR
jgi:chromosome segregation ATPase